MIFSKSLFVLLSLFLAFASPVLAMGRMGSTELPFETLYSSARCDSSVKGPAITWVTDDDAYRLLYRRLQGSLLGGPPAPEVDFKRETVILVEMGFRPSGGYEIIVNPGSVVKRDAELEVNADFKSPPPDMLTAQVITSPCVILRLKRVSFKKIRLLDASGSVVAETTP